MKAHTARAAAQLPPVYYPDKEVFASDQFLQVPAGGYARQHHAYAMKAVQMQQ